MGVVCRAIEATLAESPMPIPKQFERVMQLPNVFLEATLLHV